MIADARARAALEELGASDTHAEVLPELALGGLEDHHALVLGGVVLVAHRGGEIGTRAVLRARRSAQRLRLSGHRRIDLRHVEQAALTRGAGAQQRRYRQHQNALRKPSRDDVARVALHWIIETALQRPVAHLAYPYGDKLAAGPREFALARRAGFATAVTTRPGMVFAGNAAHPTALPRISLNGNYQDERFLPVLTSGAATALWNRFRRVDVA